MPSPAEDHCVKKMTTSTEGQQIEEPCYNLPDRCGVRCEGRVAYMCFMMQMGLSVYLSCLASPMFRLTLPHSKLV